ncbi:hypothetical protein [Stratiformator vulcanicus]|uniref:Uncharacterized protein n=1 Tax=Stratiformator vulcanicus TaxID=2527980 RepID=A0A517QX95_9PLAN|nr:hypothetical protein [Stratiformator vulcanicus]QDT36282.1 hypothetical protein Pan189_06380 [Stratiformator vulcanicus]
MDWFDVADEATPHLLRNDYAKCEEIVRKALFEEPPSPFDHVLKSEFTNDPRDVAIEINAFVERESKQFAVGAIYTETNGFDINPDRWYFDLFAYQTDGGIEDTDWISNWQSDLWPECTLTGMEDLQQIYASNELGSEAAYLFSLLVVIQFQKLIYSARTYMNIGDIPVYSTGHDYSFIARC